jgi:hypothetical protein
MAKKINKVIEDRLMYALEDFTKDISDKKFKKHVRKAGRILRDGLELPVSSAMKKRDLKN